MPLEPENPYRLKMYVLVRKDILPTVRCGVQCSHALAEYAYTFHGQNRYVDWVENHKTLIFLSATEKQITEMKEIFCVMGKRYKGFCEPDIGNVLTAVAFEPVTAAEGMQIFSDYKLI